MYVTSQCVAGPPEFQKSWWGPGYVVGAISPRLSGRVMYVSAEIWCGPRGLVANFCPHVFTNPESMNFFLKIQNS